MTSKSRVSPAWKMWCPGLLCVSTRRHGAMGKNVNPAAGPPTASQSVAVLLLRLGSVGPDGIVTVAVLASESAAPLASVPVPLKGMLLPGGRSTDWLILPVQDAGQ